MLIVSDKCGYLANRLIQFSHLISFCAEYGVSVYNPAFSEYASNFVGSSVGWCPAFPRGATSSNPPTTSDLAFRLVNILARAFRRLHCDNRFISTESASWGDPYIDTDPSSPAHRDRFTQTLLMFLLGWQYRSYDLFVKHQDVIRSYFLPAAHVQRSIDEVLGPMRQGGDVVVGVHIRQGDYRQYMSGRYFFETAVYVSYMQTLAALLQPRQLTFLVCSNVAQKPESFSGLNWRHGVGTAVGDLYALVACDYIVGPPSTFSRWASFYGRVPYYVIELSSTPLTLDMFRIAAW